jgi:hypothetical protein
MVLVETETETAVVTVVKVAVVSEPTWQAASPGAQEVMVLTLATTEVSVATAVLTAVTVLVTAGATPKRRVLT